MEWNLSNKLNKYLNENDLVFYSNLKLHFFTFFRFPSEFFWFTSRWYFLDRQHFLLQIVSNYGIARWMTLYRNINPRQRPGFSLIWCKIYSKFDCDIRKLPLNLMQYQVEWFWIRVNLIDFSLDTDIDNTLISTNGIDLHLIGMVTKCHQAIAKLLDPSSLGVGQEYNFGWFGAISLVFLFANYYNGVVLNYGLQFEW